MHLAPLDHIYSNLNRLFGTDIWLDWEIETIALELKMPLDDLTQDKIKLLQVLKLRPELFFEDMMFFLYSVEVINNIVADFDYVPMPTSLELAYALFEIEKLSGKKPTSEDKALIDTIVYFLREEGYSHPIPPFDFIPANRLELGQTEEDTEAKKQAITAYIKHMEEL